MALREPSRIEATHNDQFAEIPGTGEIDKDNDVHPLD